MPLKTNGSALRRRRLLMGLTIAEFARRAEFSAHHVSQIELGHDNAGPGFLRKASQLLDCTIEDLTDGEIPRRRTSGRSASRGAA